MGLKQNFIYSSIVTASNYVFPLIVYPYISRVLGVSNIGICNFIDSIINYFVFLSMLGISAVGIREIATAQSDRKKRSQIFSSIICLNSIFTLIAIIALILCTYFIPKLYQYLPMMYIGIIKLIGNFLMLEWLYKGLENFKYITQRTLLIKTLYVISIFVFVHNANDYTIYYLLSALMVFGNALINVAYSRHFVSFTITGIKVFKYLKPSITLGTYWILTALYTSFNTIFLGFTSNNEQVGFYTTASKLMTIIIAVYSAWTSVVMPRISSTISSNNTAEFKLLITKSISALLTFSIPTIVLSVIFSPTIVYIISGSGYEGAYLPSRIIMPLTFIVGYSQILIMQVIIPNKNDNLLFVISAIGAFIGILSNIILTPHYMAIGASLSWFISEVIVLIVSIYFTQHQFDIQFPWALVAKNVVAYLPATVCCICIYLYLPFGSIADFFIAAITMGVYAIVIQYCFLKEEFALSLINKIKIRIK
ncbi:MAG: oligosaccharide flippase family protein [Prevotella sp.]|nr:oligosaccharide flippase family protein [Prevotella sp.]